MLSGEATNINFIIFGLTRSGLELTIHRTRGEHANHYTTDAVTTNRAYSQSKMCVIITAAKISTNCHVFISSTIFYWCSLIWNSMPAAITLGNIEYDTCIEILECVCDVIAFFRQYNTFTQQDITHTFLTFSDLKFHACSHYFKNIIISLNWIGLTSITLIISEQSPKIPKGTIRIRKSKTVKTTQWPIFNWCSLIWNWNSMPAAITFRNL